MEPKWLSDRTKFERLILAGDVGGTNTSLALFGFENGAFTMLLTCTFGSQEIRDFLDPVAETLAEVKHRDSALYPSLCCISGAGPVADNVCHLTNVAWKIDGKGIEKRFGFSTVVVNDFVALGYGMPLLDVENPQQITKVPHTDDSMPAPSGDRISVIGAGTGLGTGFLMEVGGRYHAVPAEGGHTDFAPADDETAELWRFVYPQYGTAPGTEAFVSGRGIVNIFHFYKAKGMVLHGALAEIDSTPDAEKPALIARHCADTPDCRRIMNLFIRMYGHYAARAALMYIPTRGMYIASGIVEKNEPLFLENHRFMRAFESNYRDNIHAVLMRVPVFIVRDYATSLYGAANAAYSLLT